MGVPVITIDGPSGSGKGTIAARLANHLGWRILDSGALYRLLGLAVLKSGIDFKNHMQVIKKAETLSAEFDDDKVFLDGEDVTLAIRTETAGNNASKVAAIPAVRDAFLIWQRNFAQAPGLVADGRDMGTVVFPDASLKIYLEASAEERAKRRYKQLIEKGIDASLTQLVDEIKERDERDSNRAVAPLRPAEDAIVIDSTTLSVEQVLEIVIQRAKLVSTNTVR